MASAVVNLSDIVYWGEINEEKSKAPTKWDHDILINISFSDKLSPVKDILPIAALILNEDEENIQSEELYEGVDEYRAAEKKEYIEVSRGYDYTIIKIYGEGLDFNEITGKLNSAGLKNQKPQWNIDIPDRPKRLDDAELRKIRFTYTDEKREDDEKLSKKSTIKSIFTGIIYSMFVIAIIGYIAYEGLVTKMKSITPPTESFIAKKGTLMGYNVEGRMALFAFASPVEELGVDERSILLIPEEMELTSKNIVEKAVDSLGNVLYEKGVNQVEFLPPIEGFDYAKANLFKYDSYRNRDESGWAQYGILGTGKAKKIIIRGRITEREEEGYYISMGGGYARLGDLAEEGNRFYDKLADSESYISALYSLKSGRQVYMYGQIEKTYTSREGRNKKD
ncbi:hypothetical protein KAS50_08455, partial [bacterium]|nr:hypothetical protein [bacterium]